MSSLLAAASRVGAHVAVVPSAAGDTTEKTGFKSPGPNDFDFPGLFSHDGWFTKPILIVILMTIVIAAFYLATSRDVKIVPGKLQFAGESLYGFIRNDVALDAIGHEGLRFAPFLATLFSFIALNNLAGFVPVLQIPSTSHIGFPLVLAIISWVVFLYLGIRKAGPVKYFKDMMFPPGIPWPVYILLAPIEFFSTVIVRPITLMLRLTFNMFAGHLVLLLFVSGGVYLVKDYGGIGYVVGPLSLVFGVVISLFEGFIQLLQAYVFTLLTALYIGGALADEH
ncbi:MAG: F-type H+-transporting ATPase subunit a [Frankiales bacterium]|nr:F-type H+-transporting ATPase subunit a [Frankiales bacterium]